MEEDNHQSELIGLNRLCDTLNSRYPNFNASFTFDPVVRCYVLWSGGSILNAFDGMGGVPEVIVTLTQLLGIASLKSATELAVWCSPSRRNPKRIRAEVKKSKVVSPLWFACGSGVGPDR